MSIKESPIKGSNHNIDLSYLNKDDPLSCTPSAIKKQFSPETPLTKGNHHGTHVKNTPN